MMNSNSKGRSVLCPNCNHEVLAGKRFCGYCGQSLTQVDDVNEDAATRLENSPSDTRPEVLITHAASELSPSPRIEKKDSSLDKEPSPSKGPLGSGFAYVFLVILGWFIGSVITLVIVLLLMYLAGYLMKFLNFG